jgi:hypothetical protein
MSSWFYSEPFRRNHYFYGKLLTSRDFNNEQVYINEKRRLINACVLGAGIVFGLDVTVDKDGATLIVKPGVAIDPLGRELVIRDAGRYPIQELITSSGITWKDSESYYCVCISQAEFKSEETMFVANTDSPDTPSRMHNYIMDGINVSLLPASEAKKLWRFETGDIYFDEWAAWEKSKATDDAFFMKLATVFRKQLESALDGETMTDPPVCLARVVKNKAGTYEKKKDDEQWLAKQHVFSPSNLYDMLIKTGSALDAKTSDLSKALAKAVSDITELMKDTDGILKKELLGVLKQAVSELETLMAKLDEALKKELLEALKQAVSELETLIAKLDGALKEDIEKALSKVVADLTYQMQTMNKALKDELHEALAKAVGNLTEQMTKYDEVLKQDLNQTINNLKNNVENRLTALESREICTGQPYHTIELMVESELEEDDILQSDPIRVCDIPSKVEFDFAVQFDMTSPDGIKIKPPEESDYKITAAEIPDSNGVYVFQYKTVKPAIWINKIQLKWRVKETVAIKQISLTPRIAKGIVSKEIPIKMYIDPESSFYGIDNADFIWGFIVIESEAKKPMVNVGYNSKMECFTATATQPGVYRLTVSHKDGGSVVMDTMKLKVTAVSKI